MQVAMDRVRDLQESIELALGEARATGNPDVTLRHLERWNELAQSLVVIEGERAADDRARSTESPLELADHPDWDGLREDVDEKIRLLAAIWEKLDGTPAERELVRRGLVLPCLELLAHFCHCVTFDDEREAQSV